MITIDTREHLAPQIKDLLVTSIIGPEIPEVRFHCLSLGDYLLENGGHNILLERKSISDFCGSYRNLKERLAKMRRTDYERIGLLLEGTYIINDGQIWLYEGCQLKPRMSYRAFSNFITHQEELGVRLYHTMNLEETIWRLIHIHNYLPRLDSPSPVEKINIKEILSTFPGIGKARLIQLQKQYSNPLDALTNISDWMPISLQHKLNSW